MGAGHNCIVTPPLIDGTDHPPGQLHGYRAREEDCRVTSDRRMPPKGAEIVDVLGKFLIPGLWNNDLHGVSYVTRSRHLIRTGRLWNHDSGETGCSFGRPRTAFAMLLRRERSLAAFVYCGR